MDRKAYNEIADRIIEAKNILQACNLCPRSCNVNRLKGETGYCGLDGKAYCFREMLHPFEESIINPSHQIYFTGCNLRCEFCSVAEWNEQPCQAPQMNIKQMAERIAYRKGQGAKTLNLLGGEPVLSLHGILELLSRVGPDTTVVLNSNMYYSKELNSLLEGLIDIFLADFKCGNDTCAGNMLQADNYLKVICDNILSASQRADIILRHLILPGHFDCCTKPILNWVAERIPNVKLSLRKDFVPPAEPVKAPARYLDKTDYEIAIIYARNLRLNLIQ
ncbi:MAG: radical SAM protein [Sedimentisphaerales bacterium]|nr:radical SAM protein [Sedimentisphaerales bacterium]